MIEWVESLTSIRHFEFDGDETMEMLQWCRWYTLWVHNEIVSMCFRKCARHVSAHHTSNNINIIIDTPNDIHFVLSLSLRLSRTRGTIELCIVRRSKLQLVASLRSSILWSGILFMDRTCSHIKIYSHRTNELPTGLTNAWPGNGAPTASKVSHHSMNVLICFCCRIENDGNTRV